MIFATNRTPNVLPEKGSLDNLVFDMQNTQVSNEMLYCQRTVKNNYHQINTSTFFESLSQILNSIDGENHIVFYLHGFNCTNEKEIFPDTENLQYGFDQVLEDLKVIVIPLIWPCDDDHLLALGDDYYDDQKAADKSDTAFAAFLTALSLWNSERAAQGNISIDNIHLLIHSMGTRVFNKALKLFNSEQENIDKLVKNVFLVAPDIVKDALEPDQEAHQLTQAADDVVVYYAVDDLAMSASELANLKHGITKGRLGKKGIADIEKVAGNVFQVNCRHFNNHFEYIIGHRYFILDRERNVSPVIFHIADAIKNGAVTPNFRNYVLKT